MSDELLADLKVVAANDAVVQVNWQGKAEPSQLAEQALAQLNDYAEGRRKAFDLPLAPVGSAFQQRVWQALQTIPYGETTSYGKLAQQVGSSPRAVGRAVGANPLPIVVPCHRVVGHNGQMVGYSGAGGVATKQKLLALEQHYK